MNRASVSPDWTEPANSCNLLAVTVHEQAIAKVEQLPEPLAQEVNDFIDFLLLKKNEDRWRMWSRFSQDLALSESDIADYAQNLSQYEERLARGEIQW